MARKGLGKGLDSLIPDFYNEDFDSNSPQSLEDMLKESEEVEEQTEEEKPSEIEEVVIEEDEAEENDQEIVETSDEEAGGQEVHSTVQEEGVVQDNSTSEDLSSDKSSENIAQTPQEIQIQKKHVEEVKAIVDKNPRITLWSSRSSAVFRYLRKTEPEFSISKEASILIDEAVSKKYPEIWKLFED